MAGATNDDDSGRRLAQRCLVICAFAAFAAAIPPSTATAAGGRVTAAQAHSEAAAGARVLIDVRSPREWKQSGLPRGAATVTVHQPAAAFLDGILAAIGGDRDRPVALICATGNRSQRAQQFLESRGFTNVLNVDGGLYGAPGSAGWVKSGLPMDPCKKC